MHDSLCMNTYTAELSYDGCWLTVELPDGRKGTSSIEDDDDPDKLSENIIDASITACQYASDQCSHCHSELCDAWNYSNPSSCPEHGKLTSDYSYEDDR